MAENGELLALAQQIAKNLGQNDSTTEEILQMFSKFDIRFARDGMVERLGQTGDDSKACSSLDRTITSMDRRISQYVASKQPIWYDSADLSAFLDLIDQLMSTIRGWSPTAAEKSVNSCFIRAENLLNCALFRVEKEFGVLIEHGEKYLEHRQGYGADDDEEKSAGMSTSGRFEQIPLAFQVSDYNILIDALPTGAIKDMREMAKRMITAGFEKRCSFVYSSCRRAFVEESLSRLGLSTFGMEETHRISWAELEDGIDRWPKAANVAFKILFPSERKLCDEVFHGFMPISDRIFIELCHGAITQLMNLPYALAFGSQSPERLFKILDLFDALRGLTPEFEDLYVNQYCVFIRNEVNLCFRRLGEAIRGIFVELENLITNDPARSPVPRGGLHPITRYVVNYLRAACKSRQTLEQIFDKCIEPKAKYHKLDILSFSSPWVFQIAWIIELLEKNLDTKSEIYSDSALSSVFMMNNQSYIIQKVKDCEMGFLLGDEWFRRQNAKLRTQILRYQRSSLDRILGELRSDIDSVSHKAIAEKIKLFNMHFEELCGVQSTWFIFGDRLGEELRMNISESLLPAYRKFLGKFQGYSELRKRVERSVNLYRVDDVENQIKKLFLGRS